MLRRIRLTVLVCSTFVELAACGNKGPLVLPDKTPEQQQEKDRKKEQVGNDTRPAQKTSVDSAADPH